MMKPGIAREARGRWTWFWDRKYLRLAVPLLEYGAAQVYDYANGMMGDVEDLDGTNMWWAIDHDGPYLARINDGLDTGGVTFPAHEGTCRDFSEGITLVAGITSLYGTPTNNGAGRIVQKGDGSTGDEWCLAGQAGNDGFVFEPAGDDTVGNDLFISSAFVSQYDRIHITGTYNKNSGVCELYQNDVLRDNTSGETGTISETVRAVAVGKNSTTDTYRRYCGAIRYAYVFARALTHTERRMLLNDPYGPFADPARTLPIYRNIPATAWSNVQVV